MSDEDDGARVGLWVTLAIVTLMLFGLLGGVAIRSVNKHKAAPPAAATAKAGADGLLDVPLTGELIGKVHFDVGQAALPPSAETALTSAVLALGANPGKTLLISGFHDLTGDPAHNAELAKQRAKAVREAMNARGITNDRVALRKPEKAAADGPAEEARRVEIRLVTP
ncbi:MAG: OmpA family protein [Burkholderiales bacterium]|nr:OmpA family protein [Burkholderiales bacterium]